MANIRVLATDLEFPEGPVVMPDSAGAGAAGAGAVTFGNGTTGIVGVVSAANNGSRDAWIQVRLEHEGGRLGERIDRGGPVQEAERFVAQLPSELRDRPRFRESLPDDSIAVLTALRKLPR